MRTYDFTPLWRSSIGFDRVFDLLNNNSRLLDGQGDWPPYDIARTGDDTFRITLALAGFSPDEISITAQQNLLIIAGQKTEPNQPNQEFLHQGIASRPFEQKFSLEDHVEVGGASFENGLLQVRPGPARSGGHEAAADRNRPEGSTSKPAKGKTVEHVRAA